MTKAKSAPEDTSTAKTCFVMMPIADVDGYPAGHFTEVFKQLIEPAVTDAGYECTLATSTNSAHMIQLEVVTKVATADLCICDLSTNNPNVLFEYGIRQAFDKPTVLIKDDITRRIFDVSIFRDIEYDHTLRITNIIAARAQITKAIKDTVDGSGDQKQVFSLVKLMQLTKAAHLPSGEVNKDDARFALLEQKLDRLLVSQAPPQGFAVGRSAVSGKFLNRTPRMSELSGIRSKDFIVSFRDDHIVVTLPGDGEKHEFWDEQSVYNSAFFAAMTSKEQEIFKTNLRRNVNFPI